MENTTYESKLTTLSEKDGLTNIDYKLNNTTGHQKKAKYQRLKWLNSMHASNVVSCFKNLNKGV